MAEPSYIPASVRFGSFDVSPASEELRKNGVRLKLSGQAIQVLLILLEIPGQLVTREELQQKLWPGSSYGDFDHGLNAAVNRLREVLGDSAAQPRFIETVPRRGYRFIGKIETERSAEAVLEASQRQSQLARPWWQRRRNLALSGAAVLLVLLLIVGVYVLKRRRAVSMNDLKVVPFTTYPGFETAPSFSPDGNQIVFSWYHGDEPPTMMKTDLYVKQIGNEHAVRLTNHEAQFLVPAWSPDGLNIAFGMMGKDGNGIYLIPALGGRERRLAGISVNNWQWLLLSWSPDSRWVAFASDSATLKTGLPPRYRIHLLNVETAEERVLPDPAPDCTMTIEPAFSPDGKDIASVCVLTLGVNKVYVQPTDGGPPREIALVSTEYVLAGLAWTADGRSVIYSTYGTNGTLWRVPATGGSREKLSFARGTENPTVSRTGNKLAYAQTNYHFDMWSIGLTTGTKMADPASFISSSWDQANPRISPDGKLIAFDSNRSGNSEIWICDRDGSNPLQLTSFGGPPTGTPRWSPDSRRIVFESGASGHSELYVVSANGGRPQRLETGTPNAVSPFWSADGRWIYFATKGPEAVWKVPAEGGVAVRLTKEGAYPQESADGKRVFYVVGGERKELWSVSVNGGDERREEGMPTLEYEMSWAPAQNGIYFVDGPPSHLSVNYFDFAARRVKVWELHSMIVCCGIAVSRNDDTLLFSGIDHLESDIMLVEGFQ
jgi:Tol biopolymer transport system component/DNA-binding winged helix-turn-helix (wHTH) protein